MSITIDSLHELFTIKNGKLYRNNKEAGTINNGYRRVRINQKRYYSHRIMYMMYHNKYIPDSLQIDHIDGNKLNNSKENLRIVTNKQNNWNRTAAKGYTFNGSSYVAKIMKDSEEIYLGSFATKKEAREAYLKAKKEYHKI